MKRTETVKEQHYTSGIWKDIHNEEIIPIFTDNRQWIIRYYSQSPPRLYEASWSDKEGGTLIFPSTPACTIHFEAGNANQGQLVCGEATTFLERSFQPGPSNLEPPSGQWKSEQLTIEINVNAGQFVKSTLFLPLPVEQEPTAPQPPPTEESSESKPIAKETSAVTESLSGVWVEEGQIFSLVGQTHAWTCSYHPLSPNQLRCSDGKDDSYWNRLE